VRVGLKKMEDFFGTLCSLGDQFELGLRLRLQGGEGDVLDYLSPPRHRSSGSGWTEHREETWM
jgi:hypothetical protein